MKNIQVKLAALALAVSSFAMPAKAQVRLTENNVDQVIAAMTVEEKVDILIGCGMAMGAEVKFPGTAGRTRDIPRLGIPSSYLADGPHRLAMNQTREWDSKQYNTTELPSETNVAASFDLELAQKVGVVIGAELRDYGLDVLLAPGVNLMRSSLCGRNSEYYSEDPVLAGLIAASYIQGVQSQGTGTCLKHFAINNQETNRNNNDAHVSQRALRELYLKNFELAATIGKPWSIMTSYNRAQGKYTCENRDLTETILREEWGWDGLVMTDWNAGKDAVASIAAGNDMIQPGQARQREAILKAAKDGSLSMELINLSVKRTLEFVLKSHTFKGYKYANETDLKGHSQVVRQTGAESMVLFKNQANTLPMAGVKNAALYGCTSYDLVPAGMGFGATGHGYYIVSLIEGLRNAGIKADMTLAAAYTKHIAEQNKKNYPNGMPPFSITAPLRAGEMVPEAATLAENVKNNDIAIITFGRTSGEGSDRKREHFFMTNEEKQLVEVVSKAYHAAGKKVVVILNVCGPMETAVINENADAVLCAFQPGCEAGNSMVDVLTGKVNPSGKLPMTWAIAYGDAAADANFPADYTFDMGAFNRAYSGGGSAKDAAERAQRQAEPELKKNVDYTDYEEGIYIGYRYFDTFNKAVAYPFGFGLSYTTFDYSDAQLTANGDELELKVKVTNTGKVAGKEAVQLYVAAPKGTMDKPSKELKAFAKTKQLAPGESQVVTLKWNMMDMASFNEKASAWELAKGEYKLLVSASSVEAKQTVTMKVAKTRLQKVNNVMKPSVKIATSPLVARK